MCWNEETAQKPVEDVVRSIHGEYYLHPPSLVSRPITDIDKVKLLESFELYDQEYKSLLGDYLQPDADLSVLVRDTLVEARKITPNPSQEMEFNEKSKQAIPALLARIFVMFTVLKSGESYNRIETAGGSSELGVKLLIKPHNIQILTLLYMFGCGSSISTSLQSQLKQIRTGEGKSMILGAAAALLVLLGFRVRAVCYSEYLSNRDHKLFEEVFARFGLQRHVKYSTIREYAEDSIAARGDFRDLTEKLLRGTLAKSKPSTTKILRENSRLEVLLIDEVDVFFGPEFYGKTHNIATCIREPEVAEILTRIWNAFNQGGRSYQLGDIQSMPEYSTLLNKLPGHKYVVDNEISNMLKEVKEVDAIPYYLNQDKDKIGYKEMDSVLYTISYGYRTVFAYLKESENLRQKEDTLLRELVMQISLGRFSYANISPYRIIGLSGTLQILGDREKRVLGQYGLNKYTYMPSVYGLSNFKFDKAGSGIYFEGNESDFYHRLIKEIRAATSSKQAVIVFFSDDLRLKKFTNSPFYCQLGRHKNTLTESTILFDKEYIINKAATAGQVTLSPAIFGRGTDFFCKDQTVEKNGGVHIIQTFLSKDLSEEVQIQGRTARQGKQGSYQLILLESDLENEFGVSRGEMHQVARCDRYKWLCKIREQYQKNQAEIMEGNLQQASQVDKETREYFDLLIEGDFDGAQKVFRSLYEI
eukprot:scaffold22512_cov22-Cyclotella_meneghiniana.AAC.1